MKLENNIILLLILMLSCFYIKACDSQTVSNFEDEKLANIGIVIDEHAISDDAKCSSKDNFQIQFPDQTKESKISENSVKLELPENYKLAAVVNNEAMLINSIEYTCDCSSSGGCNPTKFGKEYGCMHGSCTGSCTGSHSFNGATINSHSGVVNINEPINLNEKTIQNSLSSFDDSILKFEELKDKLDKSFKELFNVTDLNELEVNKSQDLYRVPIAIFGQKANLLLTEQEAGELFYDITTLEPENFSSLSGSCTCNSGGSGCEYKTAYFGKIEYCNAGDCTSCTLN